jgi:Mannosyltransferase putative
MTRRTGMAGLWQNLPARQPLTSSDRHGRTPAVNRYTNLRSLPHGTFFDEVRRVGKMDRGSIMASLNHLIPLMNDPLPKFEGFGIVTCAGSKYLRYLWAQVQKVREVSDAPIWCYHLGPDELNHPSVDMLREMDVTFVDAIPLMRRENYQSSVGWSAKSIAVIHSPFRHVCFLDADAIPIVDPESILHHDDYSEGFLCFPDIQKCRTDDFLFSELAIKRDPDFIEAEAGQFLVDKDRMWKALQLYSFMNGRPKPFHEMAYGDKCLLQLSCMKLNIPFKMAGKAEWAGYGINHFLTDGTYAFMHVTEHKRHGTAPREYSDLLNQFDSLDKTQPATVYA